MNLTLELNKNRNKKATNVDFYQPLEFEQTSRVIPISDIFKTVNTYEVFDDERNTCTKYRLNSTINTIATNVLVNPLTQIFNESGIEITGSSRTTAISTINPTYTYDLGYDIFDNHFFRIDSFKTGNTLNDYTGTTLSDILSIQDSVDNNTFEDNGWLYCTNKTKINENRLFVGKPACDKIDLFPTRDYFGFKPMIVNNKSESNWDYCVTYPYKNIKSHNLISDSNKVNGIPIISGVTGETTENGNYLQVTTPYKHGLLKDNIIRFKTGTTSTEKTYLIYDIGDINRENKEHIFLIDIDKYSDLKDVNFINNILTKRIVKVINNIESEYYIREFRKVPNFKFETTPITIENIDSMVTNNVTEIGSDSYQLAFSRNIFGDKLQQIQFTDDIDINLLTDNLGRPLSELYLTVIKRCISTDSTGHNNVFGLVMSGIDELPGTTGYTNVRLLNSNNLDESVLEYDVNIDGGWTNNIFLGDIVEYNKITVKENILDVVQHRFNTVQREKTDNIFQFNSLEAGRNLIFDSSFELADIFVNWGSVVPSDYNHGWVKQIGVGYNGGNCIQLVGGYTNSGVNQFYTFEFGKQFTFSCKYKKLNNGTGSLKLGTNTSIFDISSDVNDQWLTKTYSFIGQGSNVWEPIFAAFSGYSTINVLIYELKVEAGPISSSWSAAPEDSGETSQYTFGIESQLLEPRNEGYYYKPHYKIPIKNFSDVVQQGELIEIEECLNCGGFVSGITTGNTVTHISGSTNNNEIKYLLLKVVSIDGIYDFDRIRVSKLDNNGNITGHTTTNVRLDDKYENTILIPYISSFYGNRNNLNTHNYTFRLYFSELIPEYGSDLGDGRITWRDFMKEGEYDANSTFSEEKQFTNGKLYLKSKVNLHVRRQDPFGYYGLKSRTFPSDLYGDPSTELVDNNKYSKPNEIC